MVVLSNELRNLLTEDSINSIMSANSGPNGHLLPEQEESVEEPIAENIMAPSEPQTLNNDFEELKSFVKSHTGKYDSLLNTMTSKINDLIKGFNTLESQMCSLNQKLNSVQQTPPQSSPTNSKETQTSIQEPKKEEKHERHPRSVDSLPSELSIENVFNCNGKKFD